MPATTTNYTTYIWWCHRLPERSFFFRGKQFPVCARCTGLWIGYVIAITSLLIYPLPWYSALLLCIPAAIDGGTQLLHWRHSNNRLRLITGIALGIGELTLAWIVAVWIIRFGYTTGLQLMR